MVHTGIHFLKQEIQNVLPDFVLSEDLVDKFSEEIKGKFLSIEQNPKEFEFVFCSFLYRHIINKEQDEND